MTFKAVSPLVSSVILMLIVLGIGVYIVAYAFMNFQLYSQRISWESQRKLLAASQDIGILATYINTLSSPRKLYVLLATGGSPVKILAVYINDTLYNDRCSISINGSPPSSIPTNGIYAPPKSFIAITCSVLGNFAKVVVIYEGGSVFAYAKAI